jgi:hypothetical protein
VSLDSLNALKQLVEVRGTGASVQQDNLEKVQGEVQQQGTSEAQRVDNLKLETVKAEYEKNLHAASVERLSSQLQREQKAVAVNMIITGVVSALAIGDFAVNLYKDLKGDQKNKDFDPSNSTNGMHGDVNVIQDPNKGKNGGTTMAVGKMGTGKGGGQTVSSITENPDGSIGAVGTATITGKDIQDKLGAKDGKIDLSTDEGKKNAEKLGLIKDGKLTDKAIQGGLSLDKNGNIDTSKVTDFQALNKLDPKLAKELFKSKEHDVKMGEADNFIDLAKALDKDEGHTGVKTLGGSGGSFADKIGAKLKEDGKTSTGWNDFKNGAKSTMNGLLQLAETVVPFFQAILAAKEKAMNTAEELQMAQEKFAAAAKKLKKLEELIKNAGAGGMGTV